MAEPARRLDPHPSDPRLNDPLNPIPGGVADPSLDPRFNAANKDARVDNRAVVESRSPGNGVIIAVLVLVLAIIGYFMFAPSTTETPPVEPTTTTEPASPDATAPAAPADPATPAPDATAPATPAPDATAPAAPADPAQPAPEATQPAEPAPAQPAPAAPAQ